MNYSRRFLPRIPTRVHPSFAFTVTLILCTLILAGLPFGGSLYAQSNANGGQIYIQDPQPLAVGFESPAIGAPTRVTQAFATSRVQPLTLAKGRFYEEDGIEGLAVGYATSNGGAVAIYRGNLDAFAPQSEESFRAIGEGRFPSPFLPNARLFELPQRPDFVATGVFTGGDHIDVVAATKGSSALYILANDGNGNFTPYPAFTLPGTVTALATTKFNQQQMSEDIVVAIDGPRGPALLVYSTSASGLYLIGAYPLQAPATALEVGNLDRDPYADVAVLAGGNLFILHGRNLTPVGSVAERLESVPLPFSSVAIALGSFIFDRDSRSQIALLASDGSLNFVVRNGFDPTPWTLEEIRARRQRMRNGEPDPYVQQLRTYNRDTWRVIESVAAVASSGNAGAPPVLMATHISDRGSDDVMVLDSAAGQMTVIAHQFHSVEDNTVPAGAFPPADLISRAYTPSSTVDALPMRINVDGRPGIMALHQGEIAPSMMMPIPDPTFFVNRTDDPVPTAPIANACNNVSNVDVSSSCSLREALLKANATAGTDTIQLAAGTFQLTRPKVGGDFSSNNGALYVNDSVNIVGAGQNSTIIQAGTTNANGVDMVMAVNEDIAPITNATASISNLTLKFGRNTGTHGNDGDGGCMEFDTGSSGNANLNLTNVTLTDCSTTQGNGAGIAIFNFVAPNNGLVTFSNSIVQNNSAVDSTAGVGAGGGGIWVSQDSRASLTNTQVLNNKATQVNGTGKGIGGGIFTFTNTPSSRQTVIHGSTISGNKSAGFGGGIFNSVNLLVDQGTVISGNIAGTDGTNPIAGQLGGGLYDNTSSNGCPGACTDTATLTKVTITGNTASATGGGIYHGNNTGGGSLTMSFSRLAGNTSNPTTSSNLFEDHSVATVTNNWWGTNAVATTITNSAGTVTFDPFIVLTHNATPAIIRINQSTTLTGDMSKDNHGNGAALSGNLNQIIGLPITFDNPVLGSIPQAQPETLNGSAQATATFNAGGTSGRGSAHATVDQAVISANSNLIASATEAATTVTITTVGAHNFAAGETVVISGVGVGGYNGTFAITGTPTSTTFTYTTTAGLGASSGGLANVGIIILEPLQITKSFNPATVAINAPSTLTFNITNPNIIAVDASFTDTFPANLQVANPPTVTNTCGGTFAPLAGDTSVTFNNAALAIGSCTITVHVSSAVDNIYSNSVTINSAAAGTGNTSSANLTVINPPHIVKAFGALSIPLNGTTSLTFTIDSNSNQNLTLNGVAFTDNLPAGLVVATPGNPTTNCSGGTVTGANGSSTVSLSGASLAPNTSCTVSVTVQGTTVGVKNNSVTVTSTNGGTGNTANASITVVGPPTISKAFGAASVPLNGTTTLTFTINNPNTTALGDLTGVAFSDTLPSTTGTLVVATPPNVTNTCGGAVTATAGTGVISLSGGSVVHNASCTLSVDVTGTVAGDAVNTTGAITSTEGGTGTTSNTATIKIVAPPTISKAFGAATIPLNGTTTVTFTITNPAANTTAENGVAFSDTLTNGLQVASVPGVSNTCGGTVTAVANSTSISLSGGTIATPGNTCTIVVNVTGTVAGTVTNTTGAVSSTNGGTGATSNTATLIVVSPPSITKAFGAATIPLNGTTSLTFTINNPNTGITLNGVAFTDSLPAGLVVASTPNLSNTCGGTATAVAGSGSVSLSGGTLAASASCTVSVDVQGTTAGVKNNSVQVTSTEGGTGNTSNASITVVAPPVIIKAFGAASIPLNGSTSLTFTIQNNNTTTTLTGVGFSDTLPAGLVISTPNGLSGSCGAGTITATQGTNVISLSGGDIAASSSCTFAVNVTGIAAGLQNNTTGNVTSTEGGTGGTASASVNVVAPPSIAKVFNPSTIALNATTSLTFTITNPAANAVALTGVAFTDTLPTGLTVANASATVCGGTLTTTNPTTIALTGATINTNSQCQFSVTVTGAASGNYTNTTGNVTSTNGGTGNTASANLTVANPPSIAKAFGAAQIPLNGTTSLTFTIQNPNTNVTLTGVSFTDNLPAGLVVATPNGLSNTCGGTATAVAGSGSVSLSGGTLASSASCTVSVNVQGTTAGVKNNSVQVTSTEGGTGNTSNASITVVAPPVIIKAFGAASIPLNGSTSLTFTIQNNNTTATLTGVGFSDTLPAGLVISTPNGLAGSCGGGTITATQGTNVISLSGASLAASSSCTFAVNVTGIAAGLQNNTTGNVTSTEGGTGGTASASINVVAPPSIAKVFNPSSIALNATTSLTFTITNPAANAVALTGVAFTDTLPTGLTVANASATVCGGTLTTTNPTTIALTGATINTNSQCQFSVTVTGAASGNYTNTTGNVTSTNGGTGNTATANLSVATPPSITKSFGAANIPLGGSTSLSFSINNPNTTISLTGVAFTDNLPAGLVVSTPNGLTGSCGGGTITAVAGSASVSLSGATLAATASCSFSVNVTGTTGGVKNNSVQVTANESGAGNTSNASITVTSPPVIIKAFGAASIPLNGSTSLQFTIQNNNTTTTLTGVGFSDTFPAGLVVATPNGLAGSCGGGTITAVAGSGTVSLSGASLAASSSCTFSINVTGTTAGQKNNTTGNVTSVEGGTGGTASASVNVVAPPSIAKVFNPSTIALNATTSLTFTITNPAANTVALTGVSFTDTLPAGLTVANASATVCGGTLTTTNPTSITLTGATIAVNSQCQFSVTVTGAVAGQYTNTTGNVTSTNGGTGNTATANLSVANPPTITKAFGAATIPLNGTTSLTFTINNPNTALALTGVAFTDNLPAGLVVATPNGLTNTCGGAVTATAGSGSVSLAGGTLAANASCTISVNVQGTTAGAKANTTGVISSTQSGPGATSNTANITVIAPPSIAKAFGAANINVNVTTSLTFTITNPNTGTALTGVAFTDILPSGLVVATPNGLAGSCGGGTITAVAGSGSVSLTGATLAASSSCNFSVNVTSIGGGPQVNTTGNVTSTNGGTGNTATATITINNFITITPGISSATVKRGQSATFTFTVNASVPGTISLFCTGLPRGTLCAFNPTTPSSSGSTAETLTISTTAPPGQSMNQPLPLGQEPVYVAMVMTLPVFGVLFVSLGRGSNRKERKAVRLVILGVLLLVALLALAGCGGHPVGQGDEGNPTPPGTYQITVTATNGTVSAQTTVTLTVTAQ